MYRDNANDIDTPDITWLCDSVDDPEDSTYTQGYCYNFLPTSTGSDAAYRFSPKDLIDIYGWTNISGSVNTFSLSNSTVLLGAFALVSQVTAVAAAAITLSF